MKEPIYKQIEKHLKELIESGEIKPGELLPSETQLSEEFNVTRMTVRSAFNNLVKEGYIRRQRGIGSIVLDSKIYDNLNKITSFTKEFQSKGVEASTIIVQFGIKQASKRVAEALEIEAGENVWEIKRIRLANGEKVCYMITYMPVKMFPNLSEKHCLNSIYAYIEECGYKVAKADRKVEAIIANAEIKDMLDLKKDAPILYIEQVGKLSNGETFEYSHNCHYGYTLTLQVVSE